MSSPVPAIGAFALLVLPVVLVAGCASGGSAKTAAPGPLRKALTFHASFDRGTDADFAIGDPWCYAAPALKRISDARPGLPGGDVVAVEPTAGRYGGALHFAKRSDAVVFYRAKDNLPWRPTAWSGTVSFWLRTDFDTLAPSYCDPVNITPREWNDAAFFVEFEKRAKDAPFRLGAYADYRVWNPKDRPWGDIPSAEKPLVSIDGPPFRADRWTHVAFTWERFNTGKDDAQALLYLDGAQVGLIRGRTQTFTWNPAETRIHLGVGYVGWLDDIAVFNRSLTVEEIRLVRNLPRGVRSLYQP